VAPEAGEVTATLGGTESRTVTPTAAAVATLPAASRATAVRVCAPGGTPLVFQLAALNNVHWGMSGEVVLMTLLGGLGTIFGPVVGAFAVLAMENYLAQLGSWVTVTEGAIFVLCVLAFRRGIFGELSRLLKRPL